MSRLEKLIEMRESIQPRINSCARYIKLHNKFDLQNKKAQKKLKFYLSGYLQKRVEKMITEEMIEFINFDHIAKKYPNEMLDAFDKDDIWEYMKDDIEEYAKNYWEE